MSIAGGPANAFGRGQSVGCDTIQIFARSPNRWYTKPFDEEQIAKFREKRLETGIAPVIAHSSYLINLASPDPALWQRSLDALLDELMRCDMLGIGNYVLHPGSHVGSGEAAGMSRVAEGLNGALRATANAGGNTRILIETTAGQGHSLGHTFEQLAWLVEHTEDRTRVGVCLDTAHVFAAGYEFRQPAAYRRMWCHFAATIGLPRLGAIHLNDSKRVLGSRVDRHEHIGQGYIGPTAFSMLVNDPALRHVPMLLETPKGSDMEHDVKNLSLLRSMIAR